MSSLAARIAGEFEMATHSPGRLRALAIELALAVNVAILAIARLATGEFPVVTMGDDERTIGFVAVIVVTLLAGLAAWGLLALLERSTTRAKPIWTAIAVAMLAISLLGPLGGVGAASQLTLALLHAGAAIPVIILMRRSASANQQDAS